MASMWQNLGNLFADTRSRVIIIFTGVVVIGATLIGIFALRQRTVGPAAEVQLVRAPTNIQSIPGATDPSAQYTKLQEKQNVQEAQRALKTGGSAIPTIIRTQRIGTGEAPVTGGSVGFQTLSREALNGGIKKTLWYNNLKQANCSPASIAAAAKAGATLKDMREVCDCAQLKAGGFGVRQLKPVCDCKDLKAAGFNATDMKNADYTAGQLRICGYDACQLRAAGYTAQQMKDGGFSDGELKGAGFGDDAIKRASGLPPGITAADVRRAGCSVEALKREREAGVSARAIREYAGCTAAQMKAAGYTAKELKDAGFTPAELKAAGFTPAQLRNAGFTAQQLRNAGFTPAQLRAAGYSPEEIAKTDLPLPPGVTPESVKQAGCSVDALRQERARGVSAAAIRKYAGCSAAQLRAAGYTPKELAEAGFTPEEIAKTDPPLPPGVTPESVKQAGCSVEALRRERARGVSAAAIRKYAGCNASQLKAAGYTAKQLADAGFTPAELAKAGFTPAEIADAEKPSNAQDALAMLRKKGCNIQALRDARRLGVTAKQIREQIGCSAAALKAAGYTAKELKDAGFTPAELKKAGFTAKQLKDAGFTAKQLADAGFTPKQLRDAGFSARDLKDAGFSPAQLKAAGFSPEAIKAAGYSKQALQDAGLLPRDVTPPTVRPTPTPTPTPTTTTAPVLGGAPVTDKALQEALARQAAQMSEQRLDAKIQSRTSQMASKANEVIATWQPVKQIYSAGELAKKLEQAAQAAGSLSAEEGATAKAAKAADQGNMLKAGDIAFAVLNTAVDSDEPGPILATIVTGKLKGTKLIGSVRLPTPRSKKVILSFNRMSMPNVDKTIAIQAVAIDPNTARTAVSTTYDRHILLRYGSLFASAFLEGYGNSVKSKGTTITVNGDSTVYSDIGRSAAENAAVGLAKVGQRWGQQLAPIFSRPYTVKVKSGASLGILFTADVAKVTPTESG